MRTSLLLLAASLWLGGCAIHQGPKGGYVFSMDLPEVFGAVMDKQPLPGGDSEVTLRKMGDQWSLKFGVFSRVLQLPRVTGGTIAQVSTVGQVTNIVLHLRTATCAQQYMLVSLNHNSQVAAYALDVPCGYVPPVVRTGQNEQFFDFVVGQRVTRYIYRAGKVTRNRDVLLSPGTELPGPIGEHAAAVSVQRRPYAAGLPFTPTAQQRQERPAYSAITPAPNATPTRSTSSTRRPSSAGGGSQPKPPVELDLRNAEPVAPTVVIDLRKS